MVIGADFSGRVGEAKRGNDKRNGERQMLVDFVKIFKMAMMNTFKKD